MSMQDQRTYTCRCGKRRDLKDFKGVVGPLKCGCGRTATFVDGHIKIQDKPKSKDTK